MRRAPFAAFSVALCLLVGVVLPGCMSYRMGDPAGLPFASIHVAPPLNTSTAPQAAALLGSAVIRELDRSGRVAIAPEDTAQARLEIVIVGITREPTISRREDTGLARRWRVTLRTECTLHDARSGTPYFAKREVSAFDEVYSDSGLVSAEYQDMPLLTSRLAEAIVREVTHVW